MIRCVAIVHSRPRLNVTSYVPTGSATTPTPDSENTRLYASSESSISTPMSFENFGSLVPLAPRIVSLPGIRRVRRRVEDLERQPALDGELGKRVGSGAIERHVDVAGSPLPAPGRPVPASAATRRDEQTSNHQSRVIPSDCSCLLACAAMSSVPPSIPDAYDPERFRADGHALIDALADALATLARPDEASVLPWRAPEAARAEWDERAAHAGSGELVADLARIVARSTALAHPRCMAHQVPPPLPGAVLAETVAALAQQRHGGLRDGPGRRCRSSSR